MIRLHGAIPEPSCSAPPRRKDTDAGRVGSHRFGTPAGWSACLLLPLWMGWVFGSLGHLGSREVADARADAERLATGIRLQLGPAAFGRGAVVVALDGHRCGCARDGDTARWDDAVRMTGGVDAVVDAPGAAFSTLVFDIQGALRFAGSPAAAGCTGDPVRLLVAAQDPSTASPESFVSACVC